MSSKGKDRELGVFFSVLIVLLNFLLGVLVGAWGTIRTAYSLMFSGAMDWLLGISAFFIIICDIALILALKEGKEDE